MPVNDPDTGVYSHRIGDLWLAGGASNSGGAVLAHYFQPHELEALRRGSIRRARPGSTITRCSRQASVFPSATPSARRS